MLLVAPHPTHVFIPHNKFSMKICNVWKESKPAKKLENPKPSALHCTGLHCTNLIHPFLNLPQNFFLGFPLDKQMGRIQIFHDELFINRFRFVKALDKLFGGCVACEEIACGWELFGSFGGPSGFGCGGGFGSLPLFGLFGRHLFYGWTDLLG
jgi:hypothetical protein